MTITPTGFTPITADYVPYISPPSTTGLEADSPPLLIDGQVAITAGLDIPTSVPISGTFGNSWVLTASLSSPYARPGDTFTVSCQLNSLTGEVPQAGSVLLGLLSSTGIVNDLPAQAFVSNLTTSGAALITGKLGLNQSLDARLQFVAYVAESTTLPALHLSPETYQGLTIRSNVLTLTVVGSALATATAPPAAPGVSVIPLHEVAVTSTGTTLRSYLVDELIDLSPTNAAPVGSSGPGLYKDLNLLSPAQASMHKRVPEESVSHLLGMTVDQVQKLERWATDLLHQVHSDQGASNSELNLLKSILPAQFQNVLTAYSQLLEAAGKHATDTAATYTPDYAHGNSIIQNNATLQHNVGQYRVQTTSTLDLNAPSFNLAAQQAITQARFEHHATDLYQGAHSHYFVRAEQKLTQMSANEIRYASQESASFAANASSQAGNTLRYSDTEWDQVGQSSSQPLHAQNSRVTSDTYGNAIKLVKNLYHLLTQTGEIVMNAAQDFHAVAQQGDLHLTGSKNTSLVSQTQNLSLYSGAKLSTYSTQDTQIGSNGTLTVASLAPLFLRGSVVLLNSGAGAVSPTPPAAPKILTHTPQTFTPLQDAALYTKHAADTPASVGQRAPLTPEPSSNSAGPERLGAYLTGVETQRSVQK